LGDSGRRYQHTEAGRAAAIWAARDRKLKAAREARAARRAAAFQEAA